LQATQRHERTGIMPARRKPARHDRAANALI